MSTIGSNLNVIAHLHDQAEIDQLKYEKNPRPIHLKKATEARGGISSFENILTASIKNHLPHRIYEFGKAGTGQDMYFGRDEKFYNKDWHAMAKLRKTRTDVEMAASLKSTLKQGAFAGAHSPNALSSTERIYYADKYVDTLMANTGGTIYEEDGPISRTLSRVAARYGLQEKIAVEFEQQMLRYKGDFPQVRLTQGYVPPAMHFRASPGTGQILIGGLQEMYVSVTEMKYQTESERYFGKIAIDVADIFGISETDLMASTDNSYKMKGILLDFWMLQHDRGRKPFKIAFRFSFPITGSYR